MKTRTTPIFFLIFSGIFSSQGQEIFVSEGGKADFGRYPANLRREAEFEIKNTGAETLKIAGIRKTCGCAEFDLSKKELAPGESARLKAAIAKNSIEGPYSKNLFVETNAPGKRFTEIGLSGNAIPLVRVSPGGTLHCGMLQSGAKWSQSFLLEPAGKKTFTLGNVVVEASQEVEHVLKKGEDGAYELTLKAVMEPRSDGVFKCRAAIPITSPPGWKDVEILISGGIRGQTATASEKQDGGKNQKENAHQSF